MTFRRQFRRAGCESGGVAIEFAIISSLLIFGCTATLEFGRALYLRNQLSYAADTAERKMLLQADISDSEIESTVRSSFRGDSARLTVTLSEDTVDGVKFRTLELRYPLALLIPFRPTASITLGIDRRTSVGLDASA